MLKRVLKNRVICKESESLDAEWRLDVAQDICQALNIVDSFSDGDKWEVLPHESDGYVSVRNTSDDDYMDGLFCEVEIGNVWAKCFAAPNREGGDYILIGKVRWTARDLLDKVTALVGCGSECALEANKRKRESRFGRNRIRKYEHSRAIYSQKHADRARELDGLKGQELFDALKPGDILEGTWGYNRTITDYFIVKRKTAKRVVVHQIERKNGDQPNDSWGGWSVCPVLPPKEVEREKDRQGTPDGDSIKLADYPKYLRIYKGDYGWENMD